MHATESTDRLLAAYKALKKIDPAKLYGGGLNFQISKFGEDEVLVEEFTVPGEETAPVLAQLTSLVAQSLNYRRQHLMSQLRDIDAVLKE